MKIIGVLFIAVAISFLVVKMDRGTEDSEVFDEEVVSTFSKEMGFRDEEESGVSEEEKSSSLTGKVEAPPVINPIQDSTYEEAESSEAAKSAGYDEPHSKPEDEDDDMGFHQYPTAHGDPQSTSSSFPQGRYGEKSDSDDQYYGQLPEDNQGEEFQDIVPTDDDEYQEPPEDEEEDLDA